jgi:Icc-related predicted phosphoesterase
MSPCFFVSDLHGKISRYEKLFQSILDKKPAVVFLGGDLLPHGIANWSSIGHQDFVNNFLVGEFQKVRQKLKKDYPKIYIILGNDDGRFDEEALIKESSNGVWEYIHNRKVQFTEYSIYGYAYVPPTPFILKDWERYDVSRYVDPGCVSPEEGKHSTGLSNDELRYSTIKEDLKKLTNTDDLSKSIFLFHTPPYKTNLDRAALNGKKIDHVPMDVNIGSIAVKQFIEERQPYLTLHGHVHESPRLTGSWQDQIGKTYLFSAAHDGPELALVQFDLDNPEKATRDLL